MSYSGECKSNFQLKLAGVTGLIKLFRFHPKYNPNNSHEDKVTPFTSHSEYNSSLWPTLKKLDFLPFVPSAITIKTTLAYGDNILYEGYSPPVVLSNNPQINHYVSWKQISRIPLESNLFFTVLLLEKPSQANNGVEVGTAGISIFDDRGFLLQGKQ